MKIKVENLTKKFRDTVAVNNLNVTFEEGKLIALLGPSGCGKSTTLFMLAGITPVTDGKIYFDDEDVTDMPAQKRGIGLVFQNYALYPHMSVLQNICFPLEMEKVPKKERIERAKEMARLVQIEDYLDRKPSQLSGGQQQRVAIARALVKKPKILLLDEPLSNLDARLRLEMREEIRRIQQETKITTIFVTHDQEEALSISDQILLMKKGEIQQLDNPQNLYDQPANTFVADFLGTPPISFLPGKVCENGFLMDDESAIIRMDCFSSMADQKNVIIGIRAEAIRICSEEEANTKAKITNLYTMGKETLATLKIGSKEVRMYIFDDIDLQLQQEVFIRFRKKGMHIFDGETTERVC